MKDKSDFLELARNVGRARTATRATEDALRAQGNNAAADTLYLESKRAMKTLLDAAGLTPKAFDAELRRLSPKGTRINVKLANLFTPGWDVRRTAASHDQK